jgi:hypothetical protein
LKRQAKEEFTSGISALEGLAEVLKRRPATADELDTMLTDITGILQNFAGVLGLMIDLAERGPSIRFSSEPALLLPGECVASFWVSGYQQAMTHIILALAKGNLVGLRRMVEGKAVKEEWSPAVEDYMAQWHEASHELMDQAAPEC